jgi:carboxypeptidase Q
MALANPAVDGRLAPTADIADPITAELVGAARAGDGGYARLTDLCDNIGARLSGSKAMERAVVWSQAQLEAVGAEKVWTEPVMVPHWERGEERAEMVMPRVQPMTILGLGGTVAGDVEAEVVMVTDLDGIGPEVEGKIVLFNIPMGDSVPAVHEYGAAVRARVNGPSLAGKHGALAAMVRSVTTRSLDTPHTGATIYAEGVPRVPAVAVTIEDADSMARIIEAGGKVRVRIKTSGIHHPDALSHNVIGEIRGAKRPKEIVLIGAHLDSWDVGHGAHDDGSGVVEVIDALRIIAESGHRPERTIRVVLFANEENGLRGGTAYAEAHPLTRRELHVAAMESDLGGGPPRFWTAGGSDADMAWFRRAVDPLGMPVEVGGGGADIRPLGDLGVLRIGYRPDDSDYFDIHHTRADTLDKINPDHLSESTAAIVGLAWRLANTKR